MSIFSLFSYPWDFSLLRIVPFVRFSHCTAGPFIALTVTELREVRVEVLVLVSGVPKTTVGGGASLGFECATPQRRTQHVVTPTADS